MEATKGLIERAKQDAREKDRQKRVKERQKREQGRAEFEALTEKAAEFVSRKLDMEIDAGQLHHQKQTWIDGDLAWDLTVDGMKFEVERVLQSRSFGLYLIPDDDGEARYIRRLADLVEE